MALAPGASGYSAMPKSYLPIRQPNGVSYFHARAHVHANVL